MLAMLRFFAQNTIEEYNNVPEIARLKDECFGKLLHAIDEQNKNLN